MALDISKAFERVWHAGLLHKLKFRSDTWPYFFFFSNKQLEVVLDESLHKNIQLMLEFLKGPILVLHFSCCILMTFLMMLSVLLLSTMMILLSILTMIRHLICSNNLNWLLNSILIYKTLWTEARSGLLISSHDFNPLAHHRNVTSLSLFYRYYFGRCSSELAQLVPLPFS